MHVVGLAVDLVRASVARQHVVIRVPRLVRAIRRRLASKAVANGELKAKVDVEANAFSKKAEEAIKAVGGNATII